MRLDAPLARLGELRIEDVRRVLGDQIWKVNHVDVCVLAPPGGVPAAQRVSLGRKRSGRGDHLAVLCPSCGRPKEILYADGHGGLSCSICSRRRTREQREVRTTAWKHGGREEDRLLRLLQRDGLPSAGLDRARVLAEEIVRGDRDRFDALRPRIEAALKFREVRAR
ncbi:hypothetical protein WMF27_41005 [Sorangium sp. So ce281]|uniref:hypothetical protein n=1 Tax=unclassified Sorangium TaxID=2621164 RepID=UPI003F631417